MTASQSTLECTHCHQRTSKDEAEQRNFNTGFCARCGGTLEPVVEPMTVKDFVYDILQLTEWNAFDARTKEVKALRDAIFNYWKDNSK